jgi:succinoglycan biosynthesis protein ExoV
MAIFYYSDFKTEFKSSNFGDDVNPYLMNRLFSPELINSEKVCVVGVGTLINDKNISKLQSYSKKVVFSSGVGYGNLPESFDNSWDFVCVRGPNSSSRLGLSNDKAICDGAILLSDFYPVINKSDRKIERVFIPHLKTHWAVGQVLKKIVNRVGFFYLTPDVPAEVFIEKVSDAKVVVTEAMHGAILADTMRVPWIPVSIHEHLRFKWEDWFFSLGLEYETHSIAPLIWNPPRKAFKRAIKLPYQFYKEHLFEARLRRIMASSQPILSPDSILKSKKSSLYDCVEYINEKYGRGILYNDK